MFFRSQGYVCLLVACFVTCVIGNSPILYGQRPPTEITLNSEWESRIQAALDAEGEWKFEDVPLIDVCEQLQEKLGIDVALDRKSLLDFLIDSATPVTLSLGGISNRSFLRLMLSELELTYTVRYGALWITTPEEAEARLVTKVFPIGDLLVRDGSRGDATPDYDSLIQAITSAISPDSWDQVGGPGAIEGIYESLVVSQTLDVHRQVEQLLTTYRAVIAADSKKDSVQQTVFMLGEQEASAAIRRALDKPVTAEFKDASLKDVVELISDKMAIPIVLDTRVFLDFGIDTSMPINGSFKETPLRFVLARILGELELTYIIRDEVLSITTPEESEAQLRVGLYPVRDLVQIAEASPLDAPGANFDFDSLIRTIWSIVAPDSWDQVGGPGAVEPLLPVPALSISQTQDVLDEIAVLLTKLRGAKQLEVARSTGEKKVDPGAHIVRAYSVIPSLHSPDEIAKLVIRASEPGEWDDEVGTFVQGLGSSLVVKHNADAHQRVRKLLLELSLTPGLGTPPSRSGRWH